MSDNDPDAPPKPRQLHRTLVVLGVVGGIISVCSGLWVVLQQFGPLLGAEVRSQSNMKQIGQAVHSYNDASTTMPGPFLDSRYDPAITPPEIPSDRLSWRVSILPYVESDPLYTRFKRSEAWNSPANRPHSDTYWHTYADPLDGKTSFTPYRVFHDNSALWDSDPKRRLALDKIPDGASNTILIAESTVQVPWAQFNEHRFDPDGPLPELGRAGRNTFFLAMADGSVRTVKKGVDPNILRAAVTREGGEQLPLDQ